MDRIPGGFQKRLGLLLRIGTMADIDEIEDALRREDFIREGVEVDAESLQAFLAPVTEPFVTETFKFNREWLRDMAARVTDLRPSNVVRQLNLPPEYVIIHRVLSAGTGVLCQLDCEIPARAESLKWVPASPTTRTAVLTAAPLASGPRGLPSAGAARDRCIAPTRPEARCAIRFSQARTCLRTRSQRPGSLTAEPDG